MLHREDPEGLIVITQPMHGWVAAQLARHWGNERFGTVAPWEEVCLGAEQHDVGMTAWERAPRLNPATGRPHTFMNMPTRATRSRLDGRRAAGARAGAVYRAAHIVARHGPLRAFP